MQYLEDKKQFGESIKKLPKKTKKEAILNVPVIKGNVNATLYLVEYGN